MIEKLWNIPVTWAWTEIRELGEVVSGGTPSTKEMSYWGSDVNWISPSDLTGYNHKTIARGAKSLTIQGLKNSSARVMPAGSIHFSSRAPIGYVVISSEPMSTNQGFKSLVPAEGLFNEYIYYYLKSAKQMAAQRATGTTFKEISGTAFGKLPFPLPPANEQKRIVAKIEELFSELDKGIENLKTAREQLRVYRQAVLKHAFEGKLTVHWREQNKDKLETAEQLLDRIKCERAALYQQQLKEYNASVKLWEVSSKKSKKPSKPKMPDSITPLIGEQKQQLPNLPYGWLWFNLISLVAESVLGKMLDKQKNTGVFRPYLRNINVRWGKFDLCDLIQMRFEDHESERYGLKEGDLVICEGGEPGRCAIWKNEVEEMRIQKALHRIRVSKNIIKPEYLFYCIIFSNETGLLRKHFTGTTIKHLTGESLANVEIPLCSIAEQEVLVKEIEGIFSHISNLENEIDLAFKRAEALRQSILKKAFSGRLVAQDSNDEPASVLLERIRAEKEAQKTESKSTNKNGGRRNIFNLASIEAPAR